MEKGSTRQAVESRKAEARRILRIPPMERYDVGEPSSLGDIATKCDLALSTVSVINQELQNPPKSAVASMPDISGLNPEERQGAVLDALLNMVVAGRNSNAAKLLLQYWGLLIEKQEVTHKVDGGDIARAFIRAGRELREGGYGVDEVSDESGVLPPELRLPTGQSAGEDATV